MNVIQFSFLSALFHEEIKICVRSSEEFFFQFVNVVSASCLHAELTGCYDVFSVSVSNVIPTPDDKILYSDNSVELEKKTAIDWTNRIRLIHDLDL